MFFNTVTSALCGKEEQVGKTGRTELSFRKIVFVFKS